MTTAERFHRATAPSNQHEVLIAGVPWPLYKVVALVAGLLVLAAVGAVASSAAAAVLSGAAVSTAIWVIAGISQHRR